MGVLIRDEKNVYNEVENPAVLFDKDGFILLKIGERKVMEAMHKDWFRKYMDAGFSFMAENLVWMDLPKEQETVDKIFNITGYIGVYLKNAQAPKGEAKNG